MKETDKKKDREILMEKYSDYILSKGKRPLNVYLFAKENDLSESDFYEYFAGFDAIEKGFLQHFFERSLKVTHEIANYDDLEAKEKLLNFYFIFFENLNINRSLVLMIFDTELKSRIRKFKFLKELHKDFIQSIDIDSLKIFENAPRNFKKYKDRPIEEVLWAHFISVFEYWKRDDSPGFEKTDIYIEKSLDTGFEVVDSPALDKLFDLGKFLWQERFK